MDHLKGAGQLSEEETPPEVVPLSEVDPSSEIVPLSVEVPLSDDVPLFELELSKNFSFSSDSSAVQEMKVRAINIAR